MTGQLAFRQVLVSLGVGDDHCGAADFQCVIDFRRLVAIVERSGDEPRFNAGEVMNNQCPAIGKERCDAVARLEPQLQVVCR